MKNKKHLLALTIIGIAGFLASCSISNQSMKTPNYHVEFNKSDFEYSNQVAAEASSVRVFMIDWERLFKWDVGNVEHDGLSTQSLAGTNEAFANQVISGFTTVIPVLGDYGKCEVSTYALYKLMNDNPGYDIVIYPQYEIKSFIVPVFYSKKTAKVTARLGKIKQ